MPIRNDRELAQAAKQAGTLLQEIQDYCLRESRHPLAKIRFPRGYILTARAYRLTLPFVRDAHTQTNLSFALMSLDVLRWLAVRTDLTGTALEMVIKEAICLLGSICECLTIRRGVEGLGRGASFLNRTARLVELGIIQQRTKIDLDWIWDIRRREHLAELEHAEFGHYSRPDCNRAINAYCKLRDALTERYG
jgi:hypothetical protein